MLVAAIQRTENVLNRLQLVLPKYLKTKICIPQITSKETESFRTQVSNPVQVGLEQINCSYAII